MSGIVVGKGMNGLAVRLDAWLEAATALWAERGIGADGLFVEQLGFDARPDSTATRRLLVQGRQVFAHARGAERGIAASAAALERALPAIAAHGWAVGGTPGWIRTITPDGAVGDPTVDTYTHSFLLLGLAEAVRVGRADGGALAAGWAATDALADREHGGFHEGRPAVLPRRSNPHMHLLEASLFSHEATGEAAHLARADAIADLFAERFLDRATGTVGEFFGRDLVRLPDASGESVEPGHMFEWCWLLHRLADAGGRDLRREARRMHDWAVAHGVRDGFSVDEAERSGRIRRASRRAWPQTELIKSAIAVGDVALAADVAARFLDTYLATAITGLWTDRFEADGRPAAPVVPASTLYHIVLAFDELRAALTSRG